MSTEVALVAAFVATLSGAYTAEDPGSYPPPGARVFIGQSVGYVSETVQGVGVEAYRWELQAAQQGNRNEGTAEGVTSIYSLTRVIRPAWTSGDWQPTFRIGPAYIDNSPFVGRTNMHLGAGIEWRGMLSLGYHHYSSGGTHRPNTGLDDIRAAIHFAF